MVDNLDWLCGQLNHYMERGSAKMGYGRPKWAGGGSVRSCIIEHSDPDIDEAGRIYEATFDDQNDLAFVKGGTTVTFDSFNSHEIHDMDMDVDIELRGNPRLSINHSF